MTAPAHLAALTVTLPPLSDAALLFAAIGCVVGVAVIWWSYRMEQKDNDGK